jgi:uncharacterized protein (TIGR02996 family)
MTDEEALRAAVLAHPDDDTPRLVYADWCEDAGQAERAAFVRAQVEAARAEPHSPTARTAAATAKQLLAEYGETWTAHLSEAVSWYGFERGFVDEVGLHATLLETGLEGVCAAEPLRRVQLLRGMAQIDDAPIEVALSSPRLAQLAALDLRHANLTASVEFETVVECPQLEGVAELVFADLRVPPEWLSRFLASQHLPGLVALDLSSIPNLGPALANGLTAATHRRFRKLNVSGVRLLSGELQRVLASRALAAVEELHLGWTFPGPGPLTMLDIGWVTPWSRLRVLDLSGQQLGPDGIREIVRKPEAAGLRWLGLAGNHIGAGGAKLLATASHLNLYYLDVSNNKLDATDLAALRNRYPEAAIVS